MLSLRSPIPALRDCWRLLAIAVIGLLSLLANPAAVSAHAELTEADPPVDGLLAAPPLRIELWFSETVDEGAGSPSIRLFTESGAELPVEPPVIDDGDSRHVVAEIAAIDAGTFTVGWSVRSASDGHTLSGTYAFRVGAARAPGAATVQGETPAPWAVATRWLTFLGAALATAGFAFSRLIAPATAPTAGTRRRTVAIAAGATIALIATLTEPLLQSWFAAAGARAPSLAEAIGGLPNGWWLRLAALAAVTVLALIHVVRRRSAVAPAIAWFGLGVGLAALLGLSLTSHGAARDGWRPVALASNLLHQWSIALWVGGLAHLALDWPTRRGAANDNVLTATIDPVRRFSRMALGLVIVGVVTGVLNAGLLLPSVQSVWNSDYGRILLIKVLLLLPVLALATFHRAALRRTAERIGSALLARRTIRLEAALALLVILGGSVLTLMAPPGTRAGVGELTRLDLAAAAPIFATSSGLVHLQLQPALPGENAVVVRLEDAEGEPPAPSAAPTVEVAFEPLDHEAPAPTVAPALDASGGYAIGGVDLPGVGWWRADVIVTPATGPRLRVPFYLMLPDPNVTGVGPAPASDAEAEQVFQRGLAHMTGLNSVNYTQRLGDGSGALLQAVQSVTAGGDGQPAAYQQQSSSFETVIIGDQQWLRQGDQPWTERPASTFPLPADWGEAYDPATGFRLGPTVEIDGELTQVVTFWTPERLEPRRQVAAWYAWWVGVESGQVHREAMISTRHYMIYEFSDFDAPLTIVPPPDVTTASSPVASSASDSG